ncbi:MAG: adenylate kinase [Synergistaceae bacterium]|nr:adenylate kinase [Synergistaceae bacterium]
MRLIFLGPPGSGKGTQAAKLIEKVQVAHISTGDILRENVKLGTALGMKAKEFMDAGKLVPDDLIIEMMKRRLQDGDCARGFILDGFPRTVPQAEALEKMLNELGLKLDAVILFKVSDEVVVERLSGRRGCRNCGAIYHIRFKPSSRGDSCQICGGDLVQREDDREEVIRKRLEVYHSQTAPLVGFYREKGMLLEVDAGKSSDEVLKTILDAPWGRSE